MIDFSWGHCKPCAMFLTPCDGPFFESLHTMCYVPDSLVDFSLGHCIPCSMFMTPCDGLLGGSLHTCAMFLSPCDGLLFVSGWLFRLLFPILIKLLFDYSLGTSGSFQLISISYKQLKRSFCNLWND